MIFIANSSGTIINSKTETVYQGTDGARTIFLICPYMSHSSVTATFILPNGIVPETYTMKYMSKINADDNAPVQGWALDVPATVMAYYGIVSVRFTWYSSTNTVVASSVTTFRVARGIAAELPESPDDDTYEKILAMLADITEYTENIKARVDTLSFHSSTSTTDGSNTTTMQLLTLLGAEIPDGAQICSVLFSLTKGSTTTNYSSITYNYNVLAVGDYVYCKGSNTLGTLTYIDEEEDLYEVTYLCDLTDDGQVVQEGDYVVSYNGDIYRIDTIDADTGEMAISWIMNTKGVETLVQTNVWVTDTAIKDGYTISIPASEITFTRTPVAGDSFLLIKQDETGTYEQATYIASAVVKAVKTSTYTVYINTITRISAVGFVSLAMTYTDGSTDTFTITFTDGSKYTFTLPTKVNVSTYTTAQNAQDAKISAIETELDNKVDLDTYTEEQEAQDKQISVNTTNIAANTTNIATNTKNFNSLSSSFADMASNVGSLTSKVTTLQSEVGDTDEFSAVADNISTAIRSLNEDIDSLQLGVVPRVIRGLIYDADPATLDDELIAALNAAVKDATGRSTPDNTDAVKVMDDTAPEEGSNYTYYYWSSPTSSEIDGWYLAEYYLSPYFSEIPCFVYNIYSNSWTTEADKNGLYYITITSDEHGMGADSDISIELLRLTDDDSYENINQYTVTDDGTIVIYSDEIFTGKIVVRVGRAFYMAKEEITISTVNGLQDALDEKADTADLDEIATNGLQAATSTTLGGVKLGSNTTQSVSANSVSSTSSRTYAIQNNSSGQLVVNVPWSNTTYSAATTSNNGLMSASDKTKLDGIDSSANNYTLPTATSTTLGGVMLGSDTVQTVTANAVYSTSSRTYAVQVNSSGQMVVNVPWSYTDTKVTQYITDTDSNVDYPILFKYNNTTNNITSYARFSAAATYNPSTNTISANAKTATVAYQAPVAEVLIRVDYISPSDESKVLSSARAMFTIGGYGLTELFDIEALDTIKAMDDNEWLDLTDYDMSLYTILEQLGHTSLEKALPATGVFDDSSVMGIYADKDEYGHEWVYLDLYSSNGRYQTAIETTDPDTYIENTTVKYYLIMREDYVNYGE